MVAPWRCGASSHAGAVARASPLGVTGSPAQNKQCRNCHSLARSGRGKPERRRRYPLDARSVSPAGSKAGHMPAYGKNLTPQEVTALVAFMQTL